MSGGNSFARLISRIEKNVKEKVVQRNLVEKKGLVHRIFFPSGSFARWSLEVDGGGIELKN